MRLPQTRRRVIVTTGLAATLVVALGACGSNKSSTNATSGTTGATTPSSASAPAPSGSPIKVAVITEETGLLSPSYSAVKPVAEAWANSVNKSGGIAGHPVQIEMTDTKGDGATATAAVTQIVGDQSIQFAIFGDGNTEAIVPAALSKGRVPFEGVQGQLPTVYGVLPNAWEPGVWIPAVQAAGAISDKMVGTKVTAVALCAETPACKGAAPSIEAALQKQGIKWGGDYILSASAPSYASTCLDIISKGVDSMLPALADQAAARLIQQCSQQGYKGGWEVSTEGVDKTILSAVPNGVTVHGPLTAFPWWVNAAPVNQYRSVMSAAGVPSDVYGTDTATATWTDLELFQKAMSDQASTLTGTVTRQEVISAFGQVKNETLGGLLPQPLTLTANKPMPQINCFFVYKYENGKFTAIPGGLKSTCAS